MKQTLIVLIISQSLFGQDPADLIGEWEHIENNAELWVTTSTDQTIADPAQSQGQDPATGAIDIDGPISGSMNYMMSMVGSYGYDFINIVLSNNPINEDDSYYYYYYEDSLPSNTTIPHYEFEFVSIPSYGLSSVNFSIFDTTDGELVQYFYEIQNVDDQITIDSTSLRINVTDLTLTNENGDTTYVLSGSLVPETIDIEAGVPTQISVPLLEEDFGPVSGDESMIWQLFGDGTGLEIYFEEDYYDSWSDTTEFEWSATDDSMTMIFWVDDYYYEEETDTMSLAYTVENDILNLDGTIDLCDVMDEDDEDEDCYEMLSMFLGIQDVQNAVIQLEMAMSYNGELAILDNNIVPETVHLYPNYPNPFNPTTTIRFNIGVGDALLRHPTLTIFDITGRLVETLVSGTLEPGQHEIQWNASQYSSGVYFLKLESGLFTKTQKMILVK